MPDTARWNVGVLINRKPSFPCIATFGRMPFVSFKNGPNPPAPHARIRIGALQDSVEILRCRTMDCPVVRDRVYPLQTRKAHHVRISRMKFSLMFNSQCRQMRISRQIAGRPYPFKKCKKYFAVTLTRMNEDYLRSFEPSSDPPASSAHVKRVCVDLGICSNSNEAQYDRPRKPDRISAVQQPFPPLPSCIMVLCLFVVSVKNEIDVRNYHRPYRLAISSTSNSSTY